MRDEAMYLAQARPGQVDPGWIAFWKANAALPPGTVHNSTVERDEVWSLEDSPHRLPDGLTVRDGATLTIAPCAVVLTGRGNGVEVQDGGGLVAGDDKHVDESSLKLPSQAATFAGKEASGEEGQEVLIKL